MTSEDCEELGRLRAEAQMIDAVLDAAGAFLFPPMMLLTTSMTPDDVIRLPVACRAMRVQRMLDTCSEQGEQLKANQTRIWELEEALREARRLATTPVVNGPCDVAETRPWWDVRRELRKMWLGNGSR